MNAADNVKSAAQHRRSGTSQRRWKIGQIAADNVCPVPPVGNHSGRGCITNQSSGQNDLVTVLCSRGPSTSFGQEGFFPCCIYSISTCEREDQSLGNRFAIRIQPAYFQKCSPESPPAEPVLVEASSGTADMEVSEMTTWGTLLVVAFSTGRAGNSRKSKNRFILKRSEGCLD